MKMPNFEDFLFSITEETLEQIRKDVNKKAEEARENNTGTEMEKLSAQLAFMSYTISIELLGYYHHWLSKELRGQD